MANLIAKKSKPLADGEFTMQCLESVADITSPHYKNQIFLKPVCVTRLQPGELKKQENLSQDFWREKLLISNCNALAIDESTDATDTAQCATFIRGTDHGHNVTEEIASLVPLKDTTTAVYSFFLRNSAPNWMYYSSCSPIWIKQTWMRISSTLLNIPLTTLLKKPFLVCQSHRSCWLSLPIKGWCPQYYLKWCCLVTDFPSLVPKPKFSHLSMVFHQCFQFPGSLSSLSRLFWIPCPLWLHLLPAQCNLHTYISI